MDSLRGELAEKEIQLSVLRSEQAAWAAFFESAEGRELGLDSPQSIARALMEARVANAEMVERLGRVEPEIGERDKAIERLEGEGKKAKARLEKVVESYKKLHASRVRIERNREMALREVGMLKVQLVSFFLGGGGCYPRCGT